MTKRITCTDMPLPEFTQLVEKTFPGSECEIRPSGAVVARGPFNPWVQQKRLEKQSS
jgi:hypothetical protein